MKYQDKSFSSRPASKEYLENWERAFGKKTQAYGGLLAGYIRWPADC